MDEFDAEARHWAQYAPVAGPTTASTAVFAERLDESTSVGRSAPGLTPASVVAAVRMTMHAQPEDMARVPNPADPDVLRRAVRGLRGPVAYHARLVVAPAAQGRGLARHLVAALTAEAVSVGAATEFGLTSNVAVARMYAARGFRVSDAGDLLVGTTRRRGFMLVRELDREEMPRDGADDVGVYRNGDAGCCSHSGTRATGDRRGSEPARHGDENDQWRSVR